VRIVAGAFGGRRLVVPGDARVRPTADRVREAWFSILGPRVVDARVVDLFAGSGALGLEALSRGAREATFVEIAGPSLAAIRANVAALGVESRTRILRQDALRYVDRLPAGAFDLALADPPYGHAAVDALVERFRAVPFARLLAVEHEASRGFEGCETRRYGDTAITFCQAP
jgi:16S rRNA (guanine966-N2)-methyltransferase